jgi:hypothetical protein
VTKDLRSDVTADTAGMRGRGVARALEKTKRPRSLKLLGLPGVKDDRRIDPPIRLA